MTPPLLPLQTSLFGFAPPAVTSFDRAERFWLDEHCWVDHCPGWFQGADALLVTLIEQLEFQQGTRLMYDRFVIEPRLTSLASLADPAVPDVVRDAAQALADHYRCPFDQLFTNYYRHGRDSVAWHADRVGSQQIDPLVAIISLGGPRRFLLRPMSGGLSQRFELFSGDLLVMGGATQHHWEHSIPKTASAPPRISVTLRHGPGAERDSRPDWVDALSYPHPG